MCQYLAIRSLLEAKEFNEALQLIDEAEQDECTNINQSEVSFADATGMFDTAVKNVSSIQLQNHEKFLIFFVSHRFRVQFYMQKDGFTRPKTIVLLQQIVTNELYAVMCIPIRHSRP